MIPLVGGVGAELVGLLSSPVAQRRDAWLESLERRLHDLEGRVVGFRFDDLGQNEHLKILSLFQHPEITVREEFGRQRDLSDQVVRDLNDRGLINDTRPYAARNRDDSESLVYYKWDVTNLGKQFLEFITSPGK